MQIPWLFPDFSQYSFFSLTFNKIPWLFPDFCQVWNFPDFSLTTGHPVKVLACRRTDLCLLVLKHWGWDKMATISQMTFWNVFSLKFVPKGQTNNISAFVQIMAWRRSGDKPLSEPMVFSLLMHICVTLPQRVKQASTDQFFYMSRLSNCVGVWPHWILYQYYSANSLGESDAYIYASVI